MDGKKEQQSTYRYSAVEAALCAALRIEPEGMSPFQARIRHLRSLGVPNLPRSGSGKHIEWSFEQILEVVFALTLQLRFGVAPRLAAEMGPAMAKMVRWLGTDSHHDDVYVILEPSGSSLTCEFAPGLETLKRKIEDRLGRDDALLIMNATSLVRKIERALTSEKEKS